MEIGKQSLDRLAASFWPRLWVLLWQWAKLAGHLTRLSHAQSWCCIHKQERNNGSKTDSGLGLSGGHLQQAGHVAFLLLQIAEYANQATTRWRRSTEETKHGTRVRGDSSTGQQTCAALDKLNPIDMNSTPCSGSFCANFGGAWLGVSMQVQSSRLLPTGTCAKSFHNLILSSAFINSNWTRKTHKWAESFRARESFNECKNRWQSWH